MVRLCGSLYIRAAFQCDYYSYAHMTSAIDRMRHISIPSQVQTTRMATARRMSTN